VHAVGFYAYQEVGFRCLLAALMSMLVSLMAGPRIIRWLTKSNISDTPEFNNSRMNELNQENAGIPTMGGLIILLSLLSGVLMWAKLDNPFVQKAIFITIWFGAIGGVDDWLKLTSKSASHSRDGLRAWEKLVFQFAGTVLVAMFLFVDFANIDDGKRLWLPFYKHGIPLANWVFVLIAIVYISATSNAVNITDGMDGLAAGCVAIASVAMVVLAYVASETLSLTSDVKWSSYLLLPHIPLASELSIFYASMCGAAAGFLWFNCFPARVFMGDTGSLPLGAAIGYGALVTRHEILVLIIGGVFVMEIASVVLQVGYFKHSGGKRIFRIAPIHHHFHHAGGHRPQIVVRFWLLAIALAIVAIATLKIR